MLALYLIWLTVISDLTNKRWCRYLLLPATILGYSRLSLFILLAPLFQAQWYHQGGEPLGRQWLRGDVVGCLVDMAERTMMVTLNGEMLFNDRGSERAAKDFDIRDGLDELNSPHNIC